MDGLLRLKSCLAVLGQRLQVQLGVQKIRLETLRQALAAGHSDGGNAERLVLPLNISRRLLAKRSSTLAFALVCRSLGQISAWESAGDDCGT
eukprot:s244_g13.t1